ncbi:aspartate carbamoyltransferase [Patescibacteria group bacterium]|nr:MAG: aspartate carbamoyltransferase [Patescibacteria group bacterium]
MNIKHVIESQQFSREDLEGLFALATSLEGKRTKDLDGKIMAALFYEPSTRTRLSFESAMERLGGNVISTENAKEFSSAAKGETLEDTIRMMHHYADAIVLRHYEKGASERASKVSSVPIINAGDGAGQHPTQGLLDLYTIQRELGSIDEAHVTMVGDLKNGRTVRSLSYLLGKYKDVTVSFVAPEALRIGDDIKEYLSAHNATFTETDNLESVLSISDVIYMTRVQKERFQDPEEYERLKGSYIFTREMADRMKESSIIMHPLPRVDEIQPEVDDSPHAAYFKQASYGVLVRMALLKTLLG